MAASPQTGGPRISDEEFLDEAYRIVLARGPDLAGLQYYLAQLAAGTPRDRIVAALATSEEAQRGRSLGVYNIPRAGQTRHCFEPWQEFVLKADGTVYPCCSHSPVGKVTTEVSLEDVMTGDALQALRHSLLTGKLDPYCMRCGHQPVEDVDHFRRDFARIFFIANKAIDGRGYIDLTQHPEVLERIRFTTVAEGCCGLGDRILLRPTPAYPEPTVSFGAIHLDQPSTAHIHLYLDHHEAPPISFRIKLGTRPTQSLEITLRGRQSLPVAIDCPMTGTIDISYSVRSVTDCFEHVEAHLSYPFFDPRSVGGSVAKPSTLGDGGSSERGPGLVGLQGAPL
jgi:radical SAM protein with 4Fe4S-binding SPASM domain